ncbi:Chitin synthase D, partial [Teratosphaeria destructans]
PAESGVAALHDERIESLSHGASLIEAASGSRMLGVGGLISTGLPGAWCSRGWGDCRYGTWRCGEARLPREMRRWSRPALFHGSPTGETGVCGRAGAPGSTCAILALTLGAVTLEGCTALDLPYASAYASACAYVYAGAYGYGYVSGYGYVDAYACAWTGRILGEWKEEKKEKKKKKKKKETIDTGRCRAQEPPLLPRPRTVVVVHEGLPELCDHVAPCPIPMGDGQRRASMSSDPTSPRRRESHRESRHPAAPHHARHRSSHSATRPERPRRPSHTGRRPSQTGRRPSSGGVEEPRATHERRERRASTSRRVSDEAPARTRRRSSAGQDDRHHHHHHHHHRTPSTPAKDVDGRSVPRPYSGAPSPGTAADDRDPMLMEANRHGKQAGDIRRQKSLVRPERRRQRDPEHDPNYYYRKHAHDMNVFPSTTGNDPQLEDEVDSSSESTALKDSPPPGEEKTTRSRGDTLHTRTGSERHPTKPSRPATHDARGEEAKQRRRQKIKEASGTPTLWGTYCHLITFWAPNPALRCFGMKQKEQQRAWREKIGLISLILLVMFFVGFLTFGFTETVCPAGGPARLRVNHVGAGYMIFHGQAYDLTKSQHPAAIGIAAGANVLWDLAEPEGGKDGSFLFQNVNGACKGLITAANHSDVVTDAEGDLAWYFPCNTFNQDGSSRPNQTIPYYLGYACHTAKLARTDFYGLRSSGDVYFTWDDVRNQSRNLIVYSGDVLDLDLLEWFNTTQVAYPNNFDTIRENAAIRGLDVTKAFATGDHKQTVECFQDIIKVGSIDTLTIGCIASKVVLYVSLAFILGIVIIKFLFALLFQWFLCRKYAARSTSMSSDKKQRLQQIEDWSDDIYRPPPKMTDPASEAGVAVPRRQRASLLPTTSRFTSPYAIERAIGGGGGETPPHDDG